jgi:hypothetical protein
MAKMENIEVEVYTKDFILVETNGSMALWRIDEIQSIWASEGGLMFGVRFIDGHEEEFSFRNIETPYEILSDIVAALENRVVVP